MRNIIKGGLILSGAILILTAGADFAAASQPTKARQSMEQCVDRVLTNLARSRAPETQVGPTVLARCQAPLRATLADAIRTGEAAMCGSVESCLPMAQERASAEATAVYRQLSTR